MTTSLDDYLAEFAPALAENSHTTLDPLHVPNRDTLVPGINSLGRKLFEAQAHVVSAGVKYWRKHKALEMQGEMGCGKSSCSVAMCHLHANGKPYRSIVMAPAHICVKWMEREIPETIGSKVSVHLIRHWSEIMDLAKAPSPSGPEWWVIGRDKCKLGAAWEAAFMRRPKLGEKMATALCPHCGHGLVTDDDAPISPEQLQARKHFCVACGSALWQYTREVNRWAPAKFIKKFLKFDYFVADEAHELSKSDSAQGRAMHALAISSRKVLAMTGTITGGSAEHIRPTLFRLFPGVVVNEGFEWGSPTPFTRAYGRIETTFRQKETCGADNRVSSGRTTKTVKCVPGIMPSLFGNLMLGNTIFLSLEQVAEGLPEYEEQMLPVEMCPNLRLEYQRIESELRESVSDMLRNGDKRLLSTMLQTLLAYPDHPFNWGEVGFRDSFGGKEFFIPVTKPCNQSADVVYPKEAELAKLCREEKAAGRQVWVYVQFTTEHDVATRLKGVLEESGLRVGVLTAKVAPEKREAWIAKHGPNVDVMISHPKLVETGVDLFDKGGAYNFCTIVFAQTGYSLFVLRQAARRAWRLAQGKACKVFFMYYKGTMSERAMALMGRKLVAAESLEGKFSSEGLAAMSDGDSMEVALAKSLANNLPENAALAWGKARGFTAPKKQTLTVFSGEDAA